MSAEPDGEAESATPDWLREAQYRTEAWQRDDAPAQDGAEVEALADEAVFSGFGFPPHVKELLHERLAARDAAVAAKVAEHLSDIELIHSPRHIHPLTESGELDEVVVLHTYCEECTPDASVSMIEDAEWTDDWPIVEHPCRTITMLRAAIARAAAPAGEQGE